MVWSIHIMGLDRYEILNYVYMLIMVKPYNDVRSNGKRDGAWKTNADSGYYTIPSTSISTFTGYSSKNNILKCSYGTIFGTKTNASAAHGWSGMSGEKK